MRELGPLWSPKPVTRHSYLVSPPHTWLSFEVGLCIRTTTIEKGSEGREERLGTRDISGVEFGETRMSGRRRPTREGMSVGFMVV